ncbi:MAG: oligopeptide/dipeptide ABC transporter ATP-binding protein, partial [Myxococcota bacterium]
MSELGKSAAPLLEVTDLKVHFPFGGGFLGGARGLVRAVDGVSFTLNRGETLGLVGESGCGKTTTGRAVLRLAPPTAGAVRFDGVDLATLGREKLRALRRRMQIVFQDPYASLDPRMTIGDIIAEPIRTHALALGRDATTLRVQELMDRVGLSRRMIRRYPHEFSGGQRQRIGIARALASSPDFIVCDEPVSALDVSVQAQILNLLAQLQRELGVAYLFIAHDLAVVRHLSHRVAVMYLGKIVESGESQALYREPRHPYTKALLASAPAPDPIAERARPHVPLGGDVPSPARPPPGCAFHPRCAHAEPRCREEPPALRPTRGEQFAACHLVAEGRL